MDTARSTASVRAQATPVVLVTPERARAARHTLAPVRSAAS